METKNTSLFHGVCWNFPVTAEAKLTAQRSKDEGSTATSGRRKAKGPQEELVACEDSITAGMTAFPDS